MKRIDKHIDIKEVSPGVMAKKKQYHGSMEVPNCRYQIIKGFNTCVAQNDKLVLLIDEEKMADVLLLGNKDLRSVHIATQMAKALKSTLSQWAEIGVEK